MKKLQQFCAAATLTLVLSLSISAGEIACPGIVAEPPPPVHQSSATGDIGTPGVATLDLLTEFTLNLLQNVQSFF
jgi:hypothetical protein